MAILPPGVFLFLFGCVQSVSPAAANDRPTVFPVDERVQSLITDVALHVIPHNYENRKKWGMQKEVVHGLSIKREGLRLKTHRRWKSVNHGTWTRYRIQLKDPDQQFDIRLNHVQRQPDGRMTFEISCTACLSILGRLSEWQRGVQLVSLSIDAEADVELTLQCELTTQWETSSSLPSLVLEPLVHDADLKLPRFRLNRVSQMQGPLVHHLSHNVRELLESQIDRRRNKIVTTINRQIGKHGDKLRLSLNDLVANLSYESDFSILRNRSSGRVIEVMRRPNLSPTLTASPSATGWFPTTSVSDSSHNLLN